MYTGFLQTSEEVIADAQINELAELLVRTEEENMADNTPSKKACNNVFRLVTDDRMRKRKILERKLMLGVSVSNSPILSGNQTPSHESIPCNSEEDGVRKHDHHHVNKKLTREE